MVTSTQLILKNARHGERAQIGYNPEFAQYQALYWSKWQPPGSLSGPYRAYTKSLPAAKAYVSRQLGYKSEWKMYE